MTEILHVYYHTALAGYLTKEKGLLFFQYDDEYLSAGNKQIGINFPLQAGKFGDDVVKPFLDGLLAEESIRIKIARLLQTDSRNTFAILERIGGDCAGALSILPADVPINNLRTPEYKYLDDDNAYDILSSLKAQPFIGDDDVRISCSGAQDKFVACIIDNRVALPLHGTPSTHIIKPNIEGLSDSVFNELFCMKLAKACGLNAPDCFIQKIKDKFFYVVGRYDRENANGQWTRIHQEDFCQILTVLPENKYESGGGPNLAACFHLLNDINVLAPSKIAFLDLVIFNYLIGNGDAHAKNFSILYKNTVPELAPCYDLLCTAIYFSPYHKNKMAMKLGGSKYHMCTVNRESFKKLSAISGYSAAFILKRLDMLASKIIGEAQKLAEELNALPDYSSDIYSKILAIIEKHCRMIKE